jgi:hypothetical protein
MTLSTRTSQAIFSLLLVGPLVAIVFVFYKPSNEMPPFFLSLLSHADQIATSAGGAIAKPKCTWSSKNGHIVQCPLSGTKRTQVQAALQQLGWVQTSIQRALDGDSSYSYARAEQCAHVSESADSSRLWLAVGCYR